MRDYGTTTEWHVGLRHRAQGLNEAILEAMTTGKAPETEGHAREWYKLEPDGITGLVFTEAVGPFTILVGNPVRGEDGTGEVDRLM